MKLIKGLFYFLVIISVLFIFTNTISAENITIRIPEEVTVTSNYITLVDIAKFENISGDSLEKLKSIQIGKTLLPGYRKAIPREQITLLIENKGFSVAEMKMDIPDMVYVKTASKRINEEILIQEAREYIKENLKYSRDKVRIKERFNPPGIVIPDKDYRIKYEYSPGSKKIGSVSIQAGIYIDNKIYKKIYLGFEVRIIKEVYVAKRGIAVGERIYQSDFYLEEKDLARFRGELINDFDNKLIENGVVGIPISRGDVLTTYYLTIPTIIHAGDVLQAEIVVGGISVITPVKARQSGKKGEYITVENIKTGHRFRAQVINSHLLRLVQ